MVTLRSKWSVVAVIASFAAVGVAHSADLAVPPLAPVQDFSGWYLRGDIGFSNQQVGSLFNANYSRFSSVDNIDKGFDAAPLFGLGVGYNINNWLRVDVTGEYRARANFHGLDIGHTPGRTGPIATPAASTNGHFCSTVMSILAPGGISRLSLARASASAAIRSPILATSIVRTPVARCSRERHSSRRQQDEFRLGAPCRRGLPGHEQHDPRTLISIYRPWRALPPAPCTGSPALPTLPLEFRHLTSQDIRLGMRFNFGAYDYPPPPPPLRSRG